jgi:hypothetical protein
VARRVLRAMRLTWRRIAWAWIIVTALLPVVLGRIGWWAGPGPSPTLRELAYVAFVAAVSGILLSR